MSDHIIGGGRRYEAVREAQNKACAYDYVGAEDIFEVIGVV